MSLTAELLAEDIGQENGAEWDSFLVAQPFYTPFQSAALLLALRGNPLYRPHGRLFRRAGSNQIVAGYVVHVIKEMTGIASVLTTRAIVNGGPILSPELEREGSLSSMVDDLLQHARLGGIYLELWHGQDPSSDMDILREKGFCFSEHLNYIIPLTEDSEQVWRNIQRRTRDYIRKSSDQLTIREVKTEDEFRALYACLKETYSRVKIPLIDRSVFADVHRSGSALFLIALREEAVVGARVVLRFGKTLYDWYAGSSRTHRDLRVNEALVWAALEYGIKGGYRCFDFGGAGRPDKPYGPREFKRKFGGRLVNYGRHRYVLRPIRYRLLELGLLFRERLLTKVPPKPGRRKVP